jgi:hypothetical protein
MLKALLSDGIIGVDEDDKPFVKIGDDIFDPVSGIAKLREHPDYKDGAKNKQNAGSGSAGSKGNPEPISARKEKLDFIAERNKRF